MLSTLSSNSHHLYHLNVLFVSHLNVHYTSRPASFHVTNCIYKSRTICTLYMLSTLSSNTHNLYDLNVYFVSHLNAHYASWTALFHVTNCIYMLWTICTLDMLSTLSSNKHNLYHLNDHFVSHPNTNCASRTASRTASTNRKLHVHFMCYQLYRLTLTTFIIYMYTLYHI